MNSTVVNALVKRRAELAGDIEKTHETLSLDALRSSLSQEAHHEGDDAKAVPKPKQEGDLRAAQMAVAKIKPRDMDELALKACLSGIYDPMQLACGSNAIIGYSVAWDLVKLTMPA
jgi:hypothetical protein